MPAHAKRIQPYSDAIPLFQRYGAEDQLAAMYQPVVQLKSGGYIVINPTEALVSIDINSGRSTREHNIEQTATATNLEAAQEIARQLRLRDMAGLVVIDFIDMEHSSNNRKVEKAMKEALKNDRARIQVGRISSFGLFEMSRQRLRTGVLEASTRVCPHCEGSGFIRTASSSGLQALRLLEEEAARGRGSRLCLHASQEAALYVLNRKRAELADIEERYGVLIEVRTDGTLDGARMSVESSGPPPSHAPRLPQPIVAEPDDDLPDEIDEIEDEEEFAGDAVEREERGEAREGDAGGRRRRRRRRRGGRRDEEVRGEGADDETSESDGDGEGEAIEVADADAVEERTDEESAEDERGRRGRRGRRGGRRRKRGGAEGAVEGDAGSSDAEPLADAEPVAEAAPVEPVSEPAPLAEPIADKPAPRRRPRARKGDVAVEAVAAEPAVVEPVADAVVEPTAVDEAAPPKRARRSRKVASDDAAPAAPLPVVEDAVAAEPLAETPAAADEAAPKRGRRRRAAAPDATAEVAPEPVAAAPAPEPVAEDAAPETETAEASADASGESPRRGWWQRTFGA
jgi:ribonuclease E